LIDRSDVRQREQLLAVGPDARRERTVGVEAVARGVQVRRMRRDEVLRTFAARIHGSILPGASVATIARQLRASNERS
jgi:hypothetical protein